MFFEVKNKTRGFLSFLFCQKPINTYKHTIQIPCSFIYLVQMQTEMAAVETPV